MGNFNLWDITPKMKMYNYTVKKERFLLLEDTYEHWTIFAVEEGCFYFEIGCKCGIAKQNDIVFCPPGIPFKRKISIPLTFHFIHFDFEGRQNSEESFNENLPVGKISISNTSRLFSTYRLISNLLYKKDSFSMAWKSQLLCDIWYIYCAEIYSFGDYSNIFSKDTLMNKIRENIRENAYQPICIKNVAKNYSLTQTQFTKRFYSSFHINPKDYILNIRLQKAQQLLLETDLSHEEISIRSGFDNGYYFSRVFKNKVGLCPSIYRKSYKI